MVCCNICVVLLFMKRDFVREMGEYENVYVAAKRVRFQNKGGERGMDPPFVCSLVLFI